MIDIHTHVLNNIRNDDGPRDINRSRLMLQKAAEDGVKTIVATPHMLTPIEGRKEEIMGAISLLNQAEIELIPGSEIFADDAVLKSDENLITLGDSNYLLIEFPRAELPGYVDEIFFELQTKGYECIFAHPERNGSVVSDPNLLIDIIHAGVLTQINAGSILGRYGKESKKTAQILLEHNMVHFIASDMHSDKNRYYSLKEAVDEASKYTENALDLVTTNPETILNKEYLEPGDPREYKKRGFWFFKF
ncbi:MAG: CpsB/CapC family capsule biosynthesis tyrosine phosphatase [Bacillota bacterium]